MQHRLYWKSQLSSSSECWDYSVSHEASSLCALCPMFSGRQRKGGADVLYKVGEKAGEMEQVFNSFFFFHSYDLYSFRRTLTRILSGWLQTARISSLVFVVRGWPCQVSVHLILRGKFLLENTNENIELSEHFFSYKSLYDVQKGTNTRRIQSVPTLWCMSEIPALGRQRQEGSQA